MKRAWLLFLGLTLLCSAHDLVWQYFLNNWARGNTDLANKRIQALYEFHARMLWHERQHVRPE